jgi:hypothetical protein
MLPTNKLFILILPVLFEAPRVQDPGNCRFPDTTRRLPKLAEVHAGSPVQRSPCKVPGNLASEVYLLTLTHFAEKRRTLILSRPWG